MSPAPLRFASPDAPTERLPFVLVGKRPIYEGEGRDRRVVRQEDVEQAFEAKPGLSYGVLLDDLLEGGGGDSDETWDFFRKVLVEENSAPEDDEDDRDEATRFRDFVTDPDLYFHPDTIIECAKALTEASTGRPTEQPGASRRTRRSAGRGSGGRR